MAWKNLTRQSIVAVGRKFTSNRCSRRVILCYHSVHPHAPFRSATPELFRDHLDWLAEHCAVLTARELAQSHTTGAPLTKPQVALTFDDGYRDNYEHALPLLRERGLRATFFLTAGFIERDPAVRVRVEKLASPPEPLSWPQAREMAAAGMEIAAHTYSHPNLAQLGPGELHNELTRTRRLMEDRLGRSVAGFAYPYGKRRHYTPEVVAAVRAAGYQYACAVCFRGVLPHDSQWTLPRFFVARDTIEQLAAKVRGDWDLIGHIQDRIPRWLSRLVSPRDY